MYNHEIFTFPCNTMIEDPNDGTSHLLVFADRIEPTAKVRGRFYPIGKNEEMTFVAGYYPNKLKNPMFQYINSDNVTFFAWSNVYNDSFYTILEDSISSNVTTTVVQLNSTGGKSVGIAQQVGFVESRDLKRSSSIERPSFPFVFQAPAKL